MNNLIVFTILIGYVKSRHPVDQVSDINVINGVDTAEDTGKTYLSHNVVETFSVNRVHEQLLYGIMISQFQRIAHVFLRDNYRLKWCRCRIG